jgi:hypothetical protein
MIGSTKVLSAFAFARVVVILLCRISDDAMFDNNAFLCEEVLPKWLTVFPCLIVNFGYFGTLVIQ